MVPRSHPCPHHPHLHDDARNSLRRPSESLPRKHPSLSQETHRQYVTLLTCNFTLTSNRKSIEFLAWLTGCTVPLLPTQEPQLPREAPGVRPHVQNVHTDHMLHVNDVHNERNVHNVQNVQNVYNVINCNVDNFSNVMQEELAIALQSLVFLAHELRRHRQRSWHDLELGGRARLHAQ